MNTLNVFANAKPELRVFFTQTLTFRYGLREFSF
jgi:hypothetical protein